MAVRVFQQWPTLRRDSRRHTYLIAMNFAALYCMALRLHIMPRNLLCLNGIEVVAVLKLRISCFS